MFHYNLPKHLIIWHSQVSEILWPENHFFFSIFNQLTLFNWGHGRKKVDWNFNPVRPVRLVIMQLPGNLIHWNRGFPGFRFVVSGRENEVGTHQPRHANFADWWRVVGEIRQTLASLLAVKDQVSFFFFSHVVSSTLFFPGKFYWDGIHGETDRSTSGTVEGKDDGWLMIRQFGWVGWSSDIFRGHGTFSFHQCWMKLLLEPVSHHLLSSLNDDRQTTYRTWPFRIDA